MTPLAGKLARLQTVIAGVTVNHEFSDWSLSINGDVIDADGFEKPADADGNYWKSILIGLVGGEVDFEGRYNSAKTPTASFKPSTSYTSLFCGLTSAIGFRLTGKCTQIGVSTSVKDAGKVKGKFFVEGVTTYPS